MEHLNIVAETLTKVSSAMVNATVKAQQVTLTVLSTLVTGKTTFDMDQEL